MGTEEHLFCYARKPGGSTAPAYALCGPYPLPTHYRGPHHLTQEGWLLLERRLEREDIAPVVDALASNAKVLDVGGGSGAVVRAIDERLGGCITVEPHAAQREHVQLACGRCRSPFRPSRTTAPADDSMDAAVATWVLHYTDDPFAAVVDLARVVDPAHPHAKVLLVQGAPDNEIVQLWNQVCAPLLGEQPDHQGFLLASAARILAITRNWHADLPFFLP